MGIALAWIRHKYDTVAVWQVDTSVVQNRVNRQARRHQRSLGHQASRQIWGMHRWSRFVVEILPR